MIRIPSSLVFLALSGCFVWKVDETQDLDGDGYTIGEGDCWDDPGALGATGLKGPDIHPDAKETWYDGVDQNCDGADDLDQDGDGYRKLGTGYSDGTPVGDDCEDDPAEDIPILNGLSKLTAADIHPGATERYYDGLDQDCGDGIEYETGAVSEKDFDQDADGAPCAQNSPADADGFCDGDCDDLDPARVPNSEPEAVWYDGIDNNCDGNDVDQDGDGHAWVGNVNGKVPPGMEMDDCADDPSVSYDPLNGFPAISAEDINPSVTETWYDGIDEDCAEDNDFDQDHDSELSRNFADELGAVGTDCFDGEIDVTSGDYVNDAGLDPADVNTSATEEWYDGSDQDCKDDSDFDQDGDGRDSDQYGGLDCVDTDELITPDAVENCGTSYDDNCNGDTNEQNSLGAKSYYPDMDGDGFGNGAEQLWCEPGNSGTKYTSATNDDCNDADAAINPAAQEICDSADTDEDCSGAADDADANAIGQTNWYSDSDADSYGDPAVVQTLCNSPAKYVAINTDCDDANKNAYPGAAETTADGVDQDCDGVDTCYTDSDSDNFGTSVLVDGSSLDCDSGTGSKFSTDCDDTNKNAYPNAAETTADGVDQDCDGFDTCYTDADGDNHGTTATSDGDSLDCDSGKGSLVSDDCNDAKKTIYLGAAEVTADGVDQDCDGVDTCYTDADGDNHGTSVLVDGSTLDCDSGTGSANADDCDDTKTTIYLGATEVTADSVDQDCDGVDTCYTDADGDNYGTAVLVDGSTLDCDSGSGSKYSTDCNDAKSAINPAAQEICDSGNTDEDCDGTADDNDSSVDAGGKTTFYQDSDGDTYGALGSTISKCDLPSGYVANSSDCNDSKSAINPAATEICDASNTDEDCDGLADDADSSVSSTGKTTYYLDSDGDTYGALASTTSKCDLPTGYVTNSTDCNDSNAAINPSAQEVCDASNTDEDCDGLADDNDTSVSSVGKTTYYRDADSDTYGALASTSSKCDLPSGYVTNSTDCDDTKSSVYPGAAETVNDGVDQDCDSVDMCYTDSDNDNYGTSVKVKGSSLSCTTGTGAPVSGDCDDTKSSINPGAAETTADGIDQDCDNVDSCYKDADNDNYGIATVVDGSTLNCDTGTGSKVSTDCDDTKNTIYPGAAETTADSIDQNCDGYDNCYTDADNDNYGTSVVITGSSLSCTTGTGAPNSTDCNDGSSAINPGAAETVADGIDQNCDNVDLCYTDADGDNYGTTSTSNGSTLNCDTGTGSKVSTDCDDTKSAIYPGAAETVADGIDQDCNSVDLCYTDADGDNYGTTSTSVGSTLNCDTGTGSKVSTDCNDALVSAYPGAAETVGDGVDQDCDGVDSCYLDSDGDNYGATAGTIVDGSTLNCDTGTGSKLKTDCNDSDSAINPGAQEVCDPIDADEDCDGAADDSDSSVLVSGKTTYYADTDTDTYGAASSAGSLCNVPTGYVTNGSDCDDTDYWVKPGGTEYCDNKQNNCSTAWTTASENNLVTKIDSLSSSATVITSSNIHTNLGWATSGNAAVYSITGGTSPLPNQINVCTSSTGEYKVYLQATTASTYTNITGMYSTLMTLNAAGVGNHPALYIYDNNYGISIDIAYIKLKGGNGVSGNFGGGVQLVATSDAEDELTMSYSDISGNTAANGAGISVAGGISTASLLYGDINLVNTKVHGNTATTNGGGIYLNTAGGVVSCAGDSTNSYGVYGNTAAAGGAAFIASLSTAGNVLTSSSCYWGNGGSANAPDNIDGTAYATGGYAIPSGNGVLTISCDYTHCF